MSKRDWRLFIYDILDCIERIENYILNIDYDEFMKDEKTKDAVVRNLEIIGEAGSKIPKDIQAKYNEIPWLQIIGLRHRLIHGYFVVDYDIVWQIIKTDIPDLKRKLKDMLEKEEDRDES